MKPNKNIKRRLGSAIDLLNHNLIESDQLRTIQSIENHFFIGVTDHIAEMIKSNDRNNVIRQQYIPDPSELDISNDDLSDPIGDKVHEPIKGIVHRYPDRVLFKIANACAVYCRYCFRREMIGPNSDVLNKADTQNALNYIKDHSKIWEVILTGGDPFILSAKNMHDTLQQLSKIEHVRTVRIHTRVPIADPKRINEKFLDALETLKNKALYIVLHINHSDELTQNVCETIKKLNSINCTLLSQSVLLKNINNNAETLENLFKDLITLNVKPYYLHHPDKASGTKHFRLALKEGLNIYQELLGRISGICLPSYMLDIPGGYGKIPINHSYIEELGQGRYSIKDYQGNFHSYKDDE